MSLTKRHAFFGWAGLLGLLAGALSMVEGVLILYDPGYYDLDSPPDYPVLAVEGAALLVLLAALSGLHARLAASYGRTGKVGFLMAFVGTALAGAGHIGAVPFFDGKAKEAYGAIIGDEAKKAEGRAQQRKAEAQKEAEQRQQTRQAQAEAKQAERQRDKQELKDKGGLLGNVGDTLPKL